MELLDFYICTAGFFFSLLILWSGVGAGVLVIPALITIFHVEPLVAIASGSAFAFLSKIMMTIGHAKQGGVDWRAAFLFLRICLPITAATASFMAYLSEIQQGLILELILIVAILAAGCIALMALLWEQVKEMVSRWSINVLSGITGVLMGLTGVGGGVMVVPALATSGGLSMKAAVATSIPVGLTLSLAVSLTLGSSGLIDYGLIVSLLVGTLIAIPIGTSLFHFFSEKLIKQVTCTLIAVALIQLVIKAVEVSQHL